MRPSQRPFKSAKTDSEYGQGDHRLYAGDHSVYDGLHHEVIRGMISEKVGPHHGEE